MKKAVNTKKTETSDLLTEFKELINLHSDKVSEYLKNEHYFQDLEEKLNDNDENDFEDLKNKHYNLGLEFRQFAIKYNINHKLIRESAINTFLKKKLFTHILKEKLNDLEKEQPNNDSKEIIYNLEEQEMINSLLKEDNNSSEEEQEEEQK